MLGTAWNRMIAEARESLGSVDDLTLGEHVARAAVTLGIIDEAAAHEAVAWVIDALEYERRAERNEGHASIAATVIRATAREHFAANPTALALVGASTVDGVEYRYRVTRESLGTEDRYERDGLTTGVAERYLVEVHYLAHLEPAPFVLVDEEGQRLGQYATEAEAEEALSQERQGIAEEALANSTEW